LEAAVLVLLLELLLVLGRELELPLVLKGSLRLMLVRMLELLLLLLETVLALEELMTTLLTEVIPEALGRGPGRVLERKRAMAEFGGNRRPERRVARRGDS
jgi:hypothetical protein